MSSTLCVGMAVYEDTEGALSTIQHIRLCNELFGVTDRVQFVVIDNSPDTNSGMALANFVRGIGGTYVPFKDVKGTSAPRNAIFDHSNATYTMAMDSHLQINPSACKQFLEFMDSHPELHGCLFTGPILNDQLGIMATHMNDQWRDRMWGTWGRAWQHECGETISIVDANGISTPVALDRPQCGEVVGLTRCPGCGVPIPEMQFVGHERALKAAGWTSWGETNNGDYIEVPGHGLGLFACKTTSWLRFPEACRGFGAEEMNIHLKYRMAGFHTYSIDFLKWWHRFYRAVNHYAPKVSDTVANHLEWDKELGLDRKVLFHAHYVGLGYMPEAFWQQVVKGIRPEATSIPSPSQVSSGRPQPPKDCSLEDIYQWAKLIPRDLEKHLPKLRELASKCQYVTEFSGRRESTVALAAALPEKFISHNTEVDELRDALQLAHSRVQLPPSAGEPRRAVWMNGDSLKTEIDETDMLFIDTENTGERFYNELKKHHSKVRKWIVRHDTAIYGETGSDKKPGLSYAIKRFLAEHPEWFIKEHTKEQHGLTVLSRLPSERPEETIAIWPKDYGPGTEFKNIMESFGIRMPDGCACKQMVRAMDEQGVSGCEKTFEKLVDEIEKRAVGFGWLGPLNEMLATESKGFLGLARAAFKNGVAIELFKQGDWNPLEVKKRPIPPLVRLSIERARKKDPSCSKKSCDKGTCTGACKTQKDA